MTVILRTTARVVVPIVVVASVALFVQGHNLPGGGFIGGVLTATAFALLYIAYGIDFLEDEVFDRGATDAVAHLDEGVVADYRRMLGVGLAVAAGSGLAAVALGAPLFSQAVALVHEVPLYVEVELASAVVFDLGVYLVVVGSLLTILSVVGTE